MNEIKKKWVVENGEGHWEVSLGDYSLSCDPNELDETIEELISIARPQAA